MIRIICRRGDGRVAMDVPVSELAHLLQEPDTSTWVDLQAPTEEEYKRVLQDVYDFHPLAIEDAIRDLHLPKLDDYGSYLYLVFHTVSLGDEPMDVHTDEIDVFLGENYLVTIHEAERRSIERCWYAQHHSQAGLARGAAMLLYELLDSQVDTYIPIIDSFEEQLEKLGDEIFLSSDSEKEMLDRLLTAKSSSLRLVRILAPQRELLGRLSTGDYGVIPTTVRMYFRDVYDHLARLVNLAESMRELSSSTIETHLALANNRMNEVMKMLTMVSTIFIPLSFIAGVYGMNFHQMPELDQPWFYPLVWVLFIGIAVTMLIVFRRRRWI
ncbi:MAG: magnesium/cobalt transporter CorA [Caldilineaceae bacterium]|nr:magnesium/cobalt transporter CorA [Caldilineaceae bacterium]